MSADYTCPRADNSNRVEKTRLTSRGGGPPPRFAPSPDDVGTPPIRSDRALEQRTGPADNSITAEKESRSASSPEVCRCGSLTFARSARLGSAGESWESCAQLHYTPVYFLIRSASFASNHVTSRDLTARFTKALNPTTRVNSLHTYLSCDEKSIYDETFPSESSNINNLCPVSSGNHSVLINCEKLNVNKAPLGTT